MENIVTKRRDNLCPEVGILLYIKILCWSNKKDPSDCGVPVIPQQGLYQLMSIILLPAGQTDWGQSLVLQWTNLSNFSLPGCIATLTLSSPYVFYFIENLQKYEESHQEDTESSQ